MNWSFLIISYLGLACVGLIDNGRGALYHEIMATLNISSQVGSQIFALSSLSSLLTLLSSRWWLKKFYLLRTHGCLLFIQAVGCFGIGWSGHLENPLPFLLFSCFIFGISLGGSSISSNLLISKGSQISHHRKTYAGLHSMYGISSLLSPLVISILRANQISWMACFMLFSLLPLIIGIAAYISSRGQVFISIPYLKSDRVAKGLQFHIGIIFALYVAAELAISSRLTFYLIDHQGIESNLARSYLSLFFALLLLGRVGFGTLRLPFANITWLKASLLFSLLFSLFGLFIHPIGLALCGLSMSFFFPCGMSWINQLAKEKSEQLISSVMSWVGVMLIVMHWFVGLLASNFNIQIALMIVPLCLAISLLAIYYFNKDSIC